MYYSVVLQPIESFTICHVFSTFLRTFKSITVLYDVIIKPSEKR